MIFTERTVTVTNDNATINRPLILYRGDKNIELKITIAESQFKFRNTDASNVIETTDASYAQLVINTPYGSPIFSDVAATKNGAVIFVITEGMIDEIREVGAYEIQIRLLDDNKQSRATIPPVSNAIEIKAPIAIEDGSAVDSNAVNVAKVNRALTTTSAPLEAFDSQGNYIKNNWGDGDPITDAALNKMEAGIDGVNKKIANNSSQIKEKTNEKSGLSGWLRSFEVDRNKKICFIGDSTTDGVNGPAMYLYECFNRYHLNSGDNLEGVTIVDMGSNGNTCYNFINNTPSEKGIDACILEQADLYVFCYGINDVRLGNTNKEQLKSYISTAIERLLAETNAYILLRIPNSLLADDTAGNNWIQPLSASQEYTDIMWEAYMELKNKWARVDIIDMQTLIFGRTVKNGADNPYMIDSLHPNKDGFYRIARCIADYIGITPKLRTDLAEIAKTTNADKPYLIYPKMLESFEYELVCEGYFMDMGSNYLDFELNPAKASRIRKGDIIKIGDKLVYDLPTYFSIYNIGTYIRLAGFTFNGYENNNKGMVRIYRPKGKIVNTYDITTSNLVNDTALKYFTLPSMRINSIDCMLAKPISSALTFKLKETYENTTKEIATITFTINNMTATVSFDETNCPNGYYDSNIGYERGALFYVVSEGNSYTGEVLMNIKVSN